MKETAADDRDANTKGKPAIHKLKMSKLVFSQLMKKDLHDMFLDGGILSGKFSRKDDVNDDDQGSILLACLRFER